MLRARRGSPEKKSVLFLCVPLAAVCGGQRRRRSHLQGTGGGRQRLLSRCPPRQARIRPSIVLELTCQLCGRERVRIRCVPVQHDDRMLPILTMLPGGAKVDGTRCPIMPYHIRLRCRRRDVIEPSRQPPAHIQMRQMRWMNVSLCDASSPSWAGRKDELVASRVSFGRAGFLGKGSSRGD